MSERPGLLYVKIQSHMCQITAYLLILNTGSGAVLSPGVSGPVTSTCQVHPAGVKPEEKVQEMSK